MAREIIVLPSGVSMEINVPVVYDWASIRVLAEAGVSYREIARRFNGLNPSRIAKHAHRENWLTPSRELKMRKELAGKQAEALARSGTNRDPVEVIQEIWEERGRRVHEKAFTLVEDALDGATENKRGKDLIQNAGDLKTIVDVGRKVTGQDLREEADSGPKMALNLAFLRSAGIQPEFASGEQG